MSWGAAGGSRECRIQPRGRAQPISARLPYVASDCPNAAWSSRNGDCVMVSVRSYDVAALSKRRSSRVSTTLADARRSDVAALAIDERFTLTAPFGSAGRFSVCPRTRTERCERSRSVFDEVNSTQARPGEPRADVNTTRATRASVRVKPMHEPGAFSRQPLCRLPRAAGRTMTLLVKK